LLKAAGRKAIPVFRNQLKQTNLYDSRRWLILKIRVVPPMMVKIAR
jgi:hypothetical protein